ncbi:MAG: hypothetical protein ABII82_10275 [Verrucomicrobiota bacterium]
MNDHLKTKLTSGRWLCTFGATVVFVFMACTDKLSNQEALNIVQMVFMFYFIQQAMKPENGGGK